MSDDVCTRMRFRVADHDAAPKTGTTISASVDGRDWFDFAVVEASFMTAGDDVMLILKFCPGVIAPELVP